MCILTCESAARVIVAHVVAALTRVTVPKWQAWNHEFFWLSMAPNGGKQPDGELLSLLKRDFGSFDNFVKEFKQAGATQFGSGWAWLTVANGKLMVEKSPNAINPLVFGHVVSVCTKVLPLLITESHLFSSKDRLKF